MCLIVRCPCVDSTTNKYSKLKISVFLEVNVTAPCRPIPMSDDHVSSANGTRKNCIPDHRLKCDFAIIHVYVLNQRYDTNMDQSY